MIADDLKARRKAARLTQFELASKIGVEQSAISHIENGARQPSIEVLTAWVRETGGGSIDLASVSASPSPKPHAVHPIVADLRAMRTARGLTQGQVAKLLDIPASTLAGREIGQSETAWADLQKWAGALGMELIHGFRPVPQ